MNISRTVDVPLPEVDGEPSMNMHCIADSNDQSKNGRRQLWIHLTSDVFHHLAIMFKRMVLDEEPANDSSEESHHDDRISATSSEEGQHDDGNNTVSPDDDDDVADEGAEPDVDTSFSTPAKLAKPMGPADSPTKLVASTVEPDDPRARLAAAFMRGTKG